MDKIRVLSVFGTRPEAIKMAPLVLELANRPEFVSMCCLTGQHRQMLDSVMEIFELKADYDLDIMEKQQTLSSAFADSLCPSTSLLYLGRTGKKEPLSVYSLPDFEQ